jgi:hypothetical protein
MRIIERLTDNYLILTDDNGSAYSFNSSFFFSEDALVSRSSISDLAFADGGIQTADGKKSSRSITVEGAIYSYTPADFEIQMRALVLAIEKGGFLSIHSDVVNRNIEVRNAKISPDWKRYAQVKMIQIVFICPFPYWQDTAYTDDTNILAGDGTFATDASGSDGVMLPIITVAADQGVDVPSFKITNMDDGGQFLSMSCALFYAGSVLVIDNRLGTIKLNANDARLYMDIGSAWLRLQSMINNFNYLGAACTVTISFKRVYA